MRRTKQEPRGINRTIDILLVSITPASSEPTDRCLLKFVDQWKHLESRLEEVDPLICAQTHISVIVSEAQEFTSDLEHALRQGLPQGKLCALRQCIERVLIDKAAQTATIQMSSVPGGIL